MRNSYYNSGWDQMPDGEKKGQPIPPAETQPYGEVYGPAQTTPAAQGELPPPQAQTVPEPVRDQVERVIITRQEQVGSTPSMGQSAPRRRSRRRTGIPGFLVCLALLALLTGGVIYLRGGVSPQVPAEGIWEFWRDWAEGNGPDTDWPSIPDLPDRGDSDGWDKFYYEEEDWIQSLKDTSIRRAPTGDGTVLALAGAMGETLTPQGIYDKVNPTIVGIQVEQNLGYSLGSGVILSPDGYIVTNAHVIAGGKRAEVILSDDTILTATLVGYDKSYDLAVLKVKVTGRELPVAEFGDSDALRVGDLAWAIGNPLGMELRGTMTDGMISAINRQVGADNGTMSLIQTTVALNSGNSGGALINAAGQVVGITNMKMMSEDETIEGLGFAIPTRSVKDVVDQIIAQGYYDDKVPLLGITVYTQEKDGTLPAGAYVASVEPESDAWKQGIRPGDIITGANGKPITSTEELLEAKAGLEAGDTLTLTVWRDRKTSEVAITLMTRHQMDEVG